MLNHFLSTFPRLRAGLALNLAFFLGGSLLLAEEPLPDTERLQSSPVLRHLVPNPAQPGAVPGGPSDTVAAMHAPEGFQVELIAAEPDLHQPIAFAFDEQGRIWILEAHSYPSKRPEGQGLDRIVIFEDQEGDGQFETRKEFISGLNLASGLEIGYGGVWVGAAPEMLFIPDRNGDDVPDGEPEVMLDGFGYQDTHECLNSFHWGPDGWLYGNQGVFNYARIGAPGTPDEERKELRAGVWRFHPVKREFEIFAHGGSNQWGLDHDERGELFMTHCRSYWGRGPTTHVIQGGHYWNQANAHHAPFIISRPPEDYPEFRNYLLASARYGHGAGGAGPRGSDMIYGGHSHVGTMIYYGDNWPDEFRGKLFTHNLGGHQINQQINQRAGSGYDTVHAGKDVLFCSDPRYVAVDLQYGPDGAVYFIDWYDRQHCHNPNNEQWDRGNGRMYRMSYMKTYEPRTVDLGGLSDVELFRMLAHKNEWRARTARRLIHERAREGTIGLAARELIGRMARTHSDPVMRLRALWVRHLIAEEKEDPVIAAALEDTDEFMRAWSVQLLAEDRKISQSDADRMLYMAQSDPSPVVRRFLASAMQRVDDETAWDLAEALAQHAEDQEDRNLPFLIWQGIAPRLSQDWNRAFQLAASSRLPRISDFVYWRAAEAGGEALNRVARELNGLEDESLRRRMADIWLAMRNRDQTPMPPAWPGVAPRLYEHPNADIKRTAEKLAASFGDDSRFPRLRQSLANANADSGSRSHAFDVLSRARDIASLNVFLQLLNDETYQSRVLPLLARFADERIPKAILARFHDFPEPDQSAALNVLTARAAFALPLLQAVSEGRLERNRLTAFHIRQLHQLDHEQVNALVAENWGTIHQTPQEKRDRIQALEGVFNEAPLWAYSANAGRAHYKTLCASCHSLNGEGTRLGPDLDGAGKNGIRYLLENIIDPNAVIGVDYQMTTVETRTDEVLSGLLRKEEDDSLVIQTALGENVVAKSNIAQRELSNSSLMPEGLLEALNDREKLELLKYLIQN